jgi:type IV pilus biogenesis protein CpaD/CtpE
MAFDQSMFAPIGAHSTDTPNLFSYKTTDTIGDVTLPGYFAEKRFQLVEGDFLLIQYNNGSDFFEVNSTKTGVNLVSRQTPLNAFGNSVQTEELTSVSQLKFDLNQEDELSIFLKGNASASASGGMLAVSSGTNQFDFAAAVSKRTVIYRAGMGLEWKGTGLFAEPILGTRQFVGFLGVTDSVGFHYEENNVFGILRNHHGECHIETLTITVGSTGAETSSVTIDGDAFNVSVTASRSASQVATEIAVSLAGQLSNWVFDAVGDTVVACNIFATDPLLVGAFDFSSAVVAATWAETQEGLAQERDFVAKADWNIRPDFDVDPQKLTPYRSTLQYLGGGAFEFFIEDKQTGFLELVHRMNHTGGDTRPSLRSPSFRIGGAAVNVSGAAEVTVKTASMQGALQGKIIFDAPSKSEINSEAAITTTATNILTIRNREEFSLTKSLSEIALGSVTASSDSTKTVIMRIIKNAVFVDPLVYAYKDEANSIALLSTDPVEVDITQGEQIDAQAFVTASDRLDLRTLNQKLVSGETLTIAMNITSGNASEMTASVTWFEDK